MSSAISPSSQPDRSIAGCSATTDILRPPGGYEARRTERGRSDSGRVGRRRISVPRARRGKAEEEKDSRSNAEANGGRTELVESAANTGGKKSELTEPQL